MEHSGSNILPKEKNVVTTEIHSVSQYIERINEYIKTRQGEDCIFVYRGEPDIYPTPCRPNIFRKDVMNGNEFFEKNLFETMRQNKLSGERRYLDNAIDAQHGEFPSRLLDVTYNCLIALYFAVTPYYHYAEDSMDKKDGMVFLFFIDEIFSPSAQNTNDNYDAIINRNREWYQKKILFEKNHKFIDHTKLNNRIIAQQGAFILFQGDEAESLPEYMSYGILIPAGDKPRIRQDLKLLFGIHTGSIYPEIINLVEELSNKSRKLNTKDFTCKNELRHALRQLNKELDYYLNYAIEQKNAHTRSMDQILIYIEHVIDSYRKGFLEFARDYPGWKTKYMEQEELKEIIRDYNRSVQRFSDGLHWNRIGDFSAEHLQIHFK